MRFFYILTLASPGIILSSLITMHICVYCQSFPNLILETRNRQGTSMTLRHQLTDCLTTVSFLVCQNHSLHRLRVCIRDTFRGILSRDFFSAFFKYTILHLGEYLPTRKHILNMILASAP